MYGILPPLDRYGLGLHMGHGAMVSCAANQRKYFYCSLNAQLLELSAFYIY